MKDMAKKDIYVPDFDCWFTEVISQRRRDGEPDISKSSGEKIYCSLIKQNFDFPLWNR